jgi:hypothetical protein
MEDEKIHTKFCSENIMGRDHLEDLGIDERVLKWIMEKEDGRAWISVTWLRIGTSGRIF